MKLPYLIFTLPLLSSKILRSKKWNNLKFKSYDPRYPKEEAKFKCFETDAIPVYPDKIFDGYCSDIHGNKYQENSTVTSCCECLL